MFRGYLALLCFIMLHMPNTLYAQQVPDDAMPGMLVHSGVRHHHIHCSGPTNVSTPTVVLEAGLGSTMLDWQSVQADLSSSFRVCSYDRGGYGWSARARTVRLVHVIADELHQLLLMAGEKPPYLIVGHSFGGLLAMNFAHRYPQKTAGLVLVDSTHPLQFQTFDQAGIPTPQAPSGGTFFIRNFANVPAALPQAIKPLAQRLAAQRKSVEVLYGELRHLRRNADLVANAFPVTNQLPVAVLSRSGDVAADAPAPRQLREKVWRDLQNDLAARFETPLLTANTTDHYIHLSDPTLTNQAIRNLIAQMP